ncbi:MAG: hypothetical protein JJT94_17695 [Bernardetiaceae bacterium]|nr:hypothetical protein [Bernardetiaceae bacterium]
MKKLTFLVFFLSLFFMADAYTQSVSFINQIPDSLSQSRGKLNLSNSGYLQIRGESNNLEVAYLQSISQLGMTDQHELKSFLEDLKEPNVIFLVHWDSQSIYMSLAPSDEEMNTWGTVEWQAYFKRSFMLRH